MGVHSGKWATLDDLSTMRNWSLEDRVALARAYASNTAMGPVRNGGVRSWTGQAAYYGAQPPVMPGTIFAFLAYGAPADDVSGNGQLYDGDAIVDSITQNWSWRDGMMLNGTLNFSGHLELAHPVGADPGDPTDPDTPPVCGLQIEADWGSGGYQVVPNLVSAALTITAANQAYVNSSTAVGGDCWTGRKGGPIDMTLALTQEDDERVTGVFDVGDNLAIKAYVSDTEFWDLMWFRVAGFTGIRADRETGAILARTINLEMNGFSGALGQIVLPDLTEYWP